LQTIDFAELARLTDELDAEKPYIELIDGLDVRKMSPKRRHGRLQGKLFTILDAWAGERGEVAPEWRFWLVPSGARRTSLVPDVAYLSRERADTLDDVLLEAPPLSPDISVEVRSPGDPLRNIERKIELYLASGTKLVLDVDPKSRSITAHDGARVRTFTSMDRFEHPAAPGLTFEVGALFTASERRRSKA